MKTEVRIEGLDGVLEMLQKLPAEVASKNGGPVRAALRKGAQVIVSQARTNLAAAIADPGKTGITETTGLTVKSVIVKRGRPPPSTKGERAVVTVRSVPHPSGNVFRRRPIKTNDIAFMLEYGTSKQAPTPWLVPAFKAKAQAAIDTTTKELLPAIERAVRRYLKKGGSL